MNQYSVIFVDDENNILQSVRRLFHGEPYQFLCAPSGAEGLSLLEKTPQVAVIISDQQMPGMGGSEFLAQSRVLVPDAIRMLLTGHSDMPSTVKAMNEGGATHFISKPWNDSALLQTVRDSVRQYQLVLENREQQATIEEQNVKLLALIGELRESNAKLEQLASSDPLTGLSNRRRLFEFLANELSRIRRYGGRLSLLMFDIDHFKRINDTWGHPAGDSVIKEIARQTKLLLRASDISARYGGEEFVILLPETDLSGAAMIADRLRLQVADMAVNQENGPSISVTVSIGVASLSGKESGEELLKRADEAMYRAKDAGRNRIELASPALGTESV